MTNFFSGDSGSNNLFSHIGESPELFQKKDIDGSSLTEQYDNLEQNYERIFVEAAESIRKSLDEFKPDNPCETCPKRKDCKVENKDVFGKYPPSGCKYRDWQLQALTYLAGDYRQRLKAEYKALMDKKENYECNNCGACCRLAVSEHSHEQLRQRASRGDKFSQDFVSVFVPYKSEDEAKKINPEYFDLLNKLVEDDKIYYYHCPKQKGNLCSIYERRPNICKQYPHNPLQLLPSECSFNAWKNEVSHAAMVLKAKVDIINFYKEQLQ